MGVSALASSVVRLIRDVRPDAEISMFVGASSSAPQSVASNSGPIPVRVLNFRRNPLGGPGSHIAVLVGLAVLYRVIPLALTRSLIKRSNWRIRELTEADFVGDIRGGDGFGDTYGLRSLAVGAIPFTVACLLGKRPVLLPQTYGPFGSFWSRRVATSVIKRASRVYSRDEAGRSTVAALGIKDGISRKQAITCPDVAFCLEKMRPDNLQVRPALPLADHGTSLVGLNVSGLLYNRASARRDFGLRSDYRQLMELVASQFLEHTRAHLLLVPHTFAPAGHPESDPDACAHLFDLVSARFPGRVHLMLGEHDPLRMKGVLGLTEFFVGSRMHACIGALSQGIPTIGLAYSGKFQGVFATLSLDSLVLDARALDAKEISRAILTAYSNRHALQPQVNAAAESARQTIRDAFHELLC